MLFWYFFWMLILFLQDYFFYLVFIFIFGKTNLIKVVIFYYFLFLMIKINNTLINSLEFCLLENSCYWATMDVLLYAYRFAIAIKQIFDE